MTYQVAPNRIMGLPAKTNMLLFRPIMNESPLVGHFPLLTNL